MADAFERQGFASCEIVTHWEEIVGAEIAAHAEPIRMQWPRQDPDECPARDPGAAGRGAGGDRDPAPVGGDRRAGQSVFRLAGDGPASPCARRRWRRRRASRRAQDRPGTAPHRHLLANDGHRRRHAAGCARAGSGRHMQAQRDGRDFCRTYGSDRCASVDADTLPVSTLPGGADAWLLAAGRISG